MERSSVERDINGEDSKYPDADIVDPDEIKLEEIEQEDTAIVASKQRRRGHGQTVVFPKGPPPPLDIVDDDLPVCDSSGQVQLSLLADEDRSNNGSGARNKEKAIHQLPPKQAALTDLRQKAASKKAMQDNIQGRNHPIAPSSKENTAQTKQGPLTRQQEKASSSPSSKFFELFPKLNEQAIDLLVRCSEPETALDMLRQALSELNTEKGIKEGMPHYRHKLMTQEIVAAQAIQASKQGKGSTPKQMTNSSNHGVTGKSGAGAQQLPQKQLSPKVLRNSQAVAVSCFLDGSTESAARQLKAGARQKLGSQGTTGNYSHQLPKRTPAAKRIDNSTKCASSEPSTNLVVSSLKSSLVTTPASPSLAALTQKELKERTRESNLIVCLYYNLACCYQRLGLLEESVEYLELASDQLEDTVQFFEAQEDSIIKSRQLRANQAQKHRQLQVKQALNAQYATEEPQRSQTQLETDQYQKKSAIGLTKQSRLLPNSSTAPAKQVLLSSQRLLPQYDKKKRQLSTDSNNSVSGAAAAHDKSHHSGKKRKELKREKISIKDCALKKQQSPREQLNNSPRTGSSAENLNNLLRSTLKGSDQVTLPNSAASASTNLLQRMSQGASKLVQTKEAATALLQVSGDHLINLHNSAEQLVQKSSGSMLPQTTKASQLQFASFTNNNYSSIIDKNSSSGRNVSPVTTASLPPEQSTVFSFNNNPTGAITVEQLLAEKMHKSRYQCKMNLQICALQSQLGKHQDALIYGRRAAQICYKLIKSAQMLCKRYVLQIQRHIQARQARVASHNAHTLSHNNVNHSASLHQGCAIATLPDQNTSGESPPSRQINLVGTSTTTMSHNFHPPTSKGPRHQKAFTEINDSFEDDYQAAQFYRKPKTRIETGSNSSNYTLSTSKHHLQQNFGGRKKSTGLKRPRSSCSSNGSSRSSQTSQQGLTRLRLSRRSTAKLGAGCSTGKHAGRLIDCASRSSCGSSHNQSCGRESSTESLDRIHTFNLKNSAGRRASDATASSVINQSETLKSSTAAGAYQYLGPETSNNTAAMLMVDGVSIAAAKQSQASIEETKTAMKAYAEDASLQGPNSQSQQAATKLAHLAALGPRNVYVEESIKVLESLIIQADPLLQELASIVKEFEDKSQKSAIDRDQDMIKKYGQIDFRDRRRRLKISFTTLKELVNIEKDQRFKLNVRNTLGVKNSQDWIFNLNIGNVMHLNMMKEQELNANIENTHELTKDTMLEKVVLITSAYFCIATEIRFILQKDLLDVKLITKKDSESYHAKALHIALLFLPEDCPLSQYINQTYCKNYLQPKLRLQKQRNAYISQKMAKQHQSRQKQLQQNLADKEVQQTTAKKASEATTSQQKRPSTSLLKEAIGSSKFLIQTKSHEGLTTHQSASNYKILADAHHYNGNAHASSKANNSSSQATHEQSSAFRKSGATPDLTVSKKSQAVLSSQAGKHHKNTCLLVGSEQKLRQPHKAVATKNASNHVPTSTNSKTMKQTHSVLLKANQAQAPRATALHRGHYPSTGGLQPVLQTHQRNTASGSALGGATGGTRRVRSPQSNLGSAIGKHGSYQHHHYTSTRAGTGNDSTKEGVGGSNRVVRESSSVRKIKIDLGVMCNQSPEYRKTTLVTNSQHQRSGSLRRHSKKSTSSVGSSDHNKQHHYTYQTQSYQNGPPKARKIGYEKKTKLHPQQVKQSMGDCSTSVQGITAATINAATSHQSTQQTQNRQQSVTTTGPSNPIGKPPNTQHQSSASQHHQQQFAQMQEKQAIMLAALKLLKMKQQSSNKL